MRRRMWWCIEKRFTTESNTSKYRKASSDVCDRMSQRRLGAPAVREAS
jgi:hypothetical protein